MSGESLARFGHHPNPAIDFCIEVEEIENIAEDARLGLTGFGHEALQHGVDARIERAMDFRVGADANAVAAKHALRAVADDRGFVLSGAVAYAGQPSGRRVVSGLGHTPGPYWIRTNSNGSHDVCGRFGKVLRSYRAEQIALAEVDCRSLQSGHTSAAKRLRDAAPDLLRELTKARDTLNAVYAGMGMDDAGRAANLARFDAAIAKATGK